MGKLPEWIGPRFIRTYKILDMEPPEPGAYDPPPPERFGEAVVVQRTDEGSDG